MLHLRKLTQLVVLSFFMLFIACNNDDDNTIEPETEQNTDDDPIAEEEEEDPIVLPEEVEIFDEGLIDNSVVLLVNNGATTSSIITKRGETLVEFQFEDNLGNDLELMENGQLLGMFKSTNPNSEISFGGFGGKVKIINPDGSIHWEYEVSTDNEIAHHDVEMLPNGNLLFIIWERISNADAVAAGAQTAGDIFPEKLIEVNPKDNTIVWQWRSWEHMIQDADPDAANFGVVSDNPQRIDVNFDIPDNGDLMHANGIDYDETNDVIYLSVNFYSEVWVIDHSTTIEEAASSAGGNFGKGGDLLYRFGNPSAYKNEQGTRLFYNNHFPNLLENGEPGSGNVLVYNNGFDIEQSIIYELAIPQPFDIMANADNEPQVVWSFTDVNLYNQRISGAVRLKNGNTLITEGDYGLWEVTNAGLIAWKYNGTGNFWRAYNYELDFPGLTALGITF